MEHLAEMYSQLREEDMWVGLWTKHCRYKETAVALAYEQQGFFEKALSAYELVLGKGRQDFVNTPAPLFLIAEERLWENRWIRYVINKMMLELNLKLFSLIIQPAANKIDLTQCLTFYLYLVGVDSF